MLRSALSVLLLCAAPLAAQITLDVEDLRVPEGSRFTLESIVFESPLADVDLPLGPPGGDVVFDFTGALKGDLRLEMDAVVLSIEAAPDAADYPQADFALRYTVRQSGGIDDEMVAYVDRADAGDRIVAIVGGSMPTITQQSSVETPMPMVYGATWTDPDTPIDSQLSPEVRMVGSLATDAEIDGWGTIEVQGGTFPYLRVHQTSSGSMRYEGNGDLEALGDVRTVSESWIWNTHHLGAVAMVAQVATTMQGGSSTTTTQVTRLVSYEGPPASAVEVLGWAHLKALPLRSR